MTHPYLDAPGPIAFSHRGHAVGAAENSAEAIAAGIALGYDYIETDVQATSDGVAVLFHDDTTDRLMGVPGRVADHRWADLSRMTPSEGGRLIRIEEVLEAHPNTRFNIDAKTDAVVQPLGDAIARHLDRVCIGSFDSRRTATLRDRFGARLCWSPASKGVARIWACGWGLPAPSEVPPCLQVPTHFKGIPIVTRRFLDAAHARGSQVHVWTIDDPAQMNALLDLGVDGLMTDRAEVLRDVMIARDFWPSRG